MANPIQVSLALADAADNNIAASQSPGAGAITLNGTVGTGTLTTARRVIVTSGGNDTAITFTVIGTNRNGNAQSETITGASGAAASTTQDFLTVTSVTHTGSVAGTVKVGTNGVASSQWCSINYHTTPVNIGVGVVVSGTVNFTVEVTYDNPNSPFTGTFPTAFSVSALASKAANTDSIISTPAYAYRVTQNSFSSGGTIKMIGIQAGLGFGN
jgi:hypothetical protein